MMSLISKLMTRTWCPNFQGKRYTYSKIYSLVVILDKYLCLRKSFWKRVAFLSRLIRACACSPLSTTTQLLAREYASKPRYTYVPQWVHACIFTPRWSRISDRSPGVKFISDQFGAFLTVALNLNRSLMASKKNSGN